MSCEIVNTCGWALADVFRSQTKKLIGRSLTEVTVLKQLASICLMQENFMTMLEIYFLALFIFSRKS